MSAASYAKILGANDRVRTGIVGCGDRMLGGDVPAFVANQKDMNFELVAVSDIWKLRARRGPRLRSRSWPEARSTWCATTKSCTRARTSTPC